MSACPVAPGRFSGTTPPLRQRWPGSSSRASLVPSGESAIPFTWVVAGTCTGRCVTAAWPSAGLNRTEKSPVRPHAEPLLELFCAASTKVRSSAAAVAMTNVLKGRGGRIVASIAPLSVPLMTAR
jgi:hypothetical protein